MTARAIQGDNYPARYNLTPAEQDRILQFAANKGYVTSNDILSFKRQYNVTSKPIHVLLTELNVEIRNVVERRDTPKPKPREVKAAQNTPKPLPPKDPPQRCGTEDVGAMELLKFQERLFDKERQLDAAKQSLDVEIAALRRERDEARKQIAETAKLRRSTSDERKESYELKQKNEKLQRANQELRRRLDPNSSEWVGELEVHHTLNMKRKIKDLEHENEKLLGRLEAFHSTDAKNLNLYFARHLPIDTLAPLLVAIHFEIERRKRGGRMNAGS